MYKFTSVVLLVFVLVFGVTFLFERCKRVEIEDKYSSAVAKLEGMQQETKTANSVRAIIEEDLKAQADALQEIINDRDERIVSQTKINLKLKQKLLKAKNAKESVVDKKGNTVVVTEVNKCDEGLRHKVDFEIVEKPVKVSGYTLTNPPYAELKLSWVKDLNLEINLTKDGDGNFRMYTDSTDFKISNLVLKIDPSVFELRWYQRISFGADLYAGEFGSGLSLRPGYDVLDNLNVNFLCVLQYNGQSAKIFYGIGVSWRPWK